VGSLPVRTPLEEAIDRFADALETHLHLDDMLSPPHASLSATIPRPRKAEAPR
jgi:hypothetical protein